MTRMFVAMTVLVAALATGSTARAQGAPVGEATEDEKSAASDAFREARTAFDDRRFADALEKFRDSYDIVASPNTHLMIAHALRELDRKAEAYRELGLVAREARRAAEKDSKYEKSVELAEEERKTLREEIALVSVKLPQTGPGATLTVAGREIPKEEWDAPIPADPGRITLGLSAGEQSKIERIDVKAGGEASVDLTRPKKANEEQPFQLQWGGTQRYVAYGVAGLGVLVLAASATTGGLALSKHEELEDACGETPCPSRQDDIDEGRSLRDASNATLIVGLLAVGAGVTLFFTAPDEGGGDESATWLEIGPGSLHLRGQF